MNFDVNLEFNSSASQLLHTLASADLAGVRCGKLKITNYTFQQTPNNVPLPSTTTLTATVNTAGLPEIVQKFAGSHFSAQLISHYHASNPAHFAHTVNLGKLPVKLNITGELTPLGEQKTALRYYGEIQVKIPFLGKNIENQLIKQLPKLLEQDANLIKQLLQK